MKIIRPALLLAGIVFAVTATPALAASPIAGPSPAASNERPAGVTLAAKKKWYYNKHRHGDRRRYRDRHHRHYYDGFYYSAPFWLFVAPYAYNSYDYGYYDYDDFDDYDDYDDYGRGGDAHVRWCLNRYRSYDIRSDSFLGYDGDRHRCNSPFD